MTTWQASFNGCLKGAIGITYHITAEVTAESKEEASIKLYDRYEHITRLTLTPVKETT